MNLEGGVGTKEISRDRAHWSEEGLKLKRSGPWEIGSHRGQRY